MPAIHPVTEGEAWVRSVPEEGVNGAFALRVGAGCPAKARPVWLSGTTVYFYDEEANADKPWRKVSDRSSYAATVTDLDFASPCIPDAFGTPRNHTGNTARFSCGPLLSKNYFMVIIE